MRRLSTVVLMCLFSVGAMSQQDPQFTQYMHNKLSVNPGYAGSGEALCGVLLGRQMWMGFDNAPRTFLLSADMPIYQYNSAVGLNVIQDQLGFEKNLMVNAALAYRLPLAIVPGGKLGIGLNVGLLNKSIGGAWRAPEVNHLYDDAIPNASVSDMALDLGFGIYYHAPQLYVGLSSTHLPASTLDEIKDAGTSVDGYKIARHYYLMAGYKHTLNQLIDVLPSILVKTDAASTQLDMNVNFMYDNRFWAGASYRITDAAALMVGFQKTSNTGTMKAGLSYDITLSNPVRTGGSRGSFEVMLGYCYPIGGMPKPTRHRNVRTL